MAPVQVRKFVTVVDEIFHEGGPRSASPPRRGVIAAVCANPFAGRYVEDIQPWMEDLKPLGTGMAKRLFAALGIEPGQVEGYGKGIIIGEAGEIEHGALWHNPGGFAMRDLIPGSKAIVPSAKKVGGPGTRLDVPITHVTASYVRSHFDAIEVGIADAPRSHEIVFILAMTTGPRVHNRAGGLAVADIKGEDGLR